MDATVGPANNPFGEFVAGVRATSAGSNATTTRRRVLNHIRIDLRNLPVNGTYRVIHPFGTNTFNVTLGPNGRREVDFVQQTGGANFNAALNGPVGPFVRPVNSPDPRFIGSPDTAQRVTGAVAPGRNFFRIIGPANADLGGVAPRQNIITQTRFSVAGQVQ
jgi:hypothetical protein